MGYAKTAVLVIVTLIAAQVLGGILGAIGDVYLGSLIVGTPLGAQSQMSPLLWTGIALGLIYTVKELRD